MMECGTLGVDLCDFGPHSVSSGNMTLCQGNGPGTQTAFRPSQSQSKVDSILYPRSSGARPAPHTTARLGLGAPPSMRCPGPPRSPRCPWPARGAARGHRRARGSGARRPGGGGRGRDTWPGGGGAADEAVAELLRSAPVRAAVTMSWQIFVRGRQARRKARRRPGKSPQALEEGAR